MSSKKPEETVGTVPLEKIERAIHLVRRQKVILAADWAELYGVVTRLPRIARPLALSVTTQKGH